MPIAINGSGTITGASTLATTVVSPTFTTATLTTATLTTPNIDSAQFATVTGTAPIYPCRAWVNFNGTGAVAIRASGNVTSITDNGTGDYTVNFTTAMPDANFSVTALLDNTASNSGSVVVAATQTGTFATSSIRILSRNAGAPASPIDSASVCVAIFR
jgi:hypothetical protein